MRTTLAAVAAFAAALTAGLTVSSPASAAATPTLRFHGAQYDSPGKDTRTDASLNNEWISLINTGAKPVNLKGYTIRDKANHVHVLGNVTIAARNGRLWLHTGKGTGTTAHRYWAQGNHVWNNTGDTAYLRTPAGATVDTCTWANKAGRTWVAC